MQIWRICRERYGQDASAGEGARLYGGRWNSKGVKMVYTSTSLALAAVETFVHIEPKLQPDDLVSIRAELPQELATDRLSVDLLPADWESSQDEALREFGDEWIRAGKTVGLQVPSAAIQGEWNVLLNPVHRDFSKIRVQGAIPFRFSFGMFR